MYYVIDYLTNPSVDDPDEGPFLEIHEEDVVIKGADAWQTGQRFDAKIPTPIKIEATAHEGFKGPPHDFFDGAIAFMSPRLLAVLKKQGVDNFDLYPAIIKYRKSKEAHEVFAFNLIGLISAVDRSKSQIRNHDGDLKIDSTIEGFEVDPAKAKDLGMFRLAENSMTVVVHERVKKAIVDAGINTFAFVDTKEWTQL